MGRPETPLSPESAVSGRITALPPGALIVAVAVAGACALAWWWLLAGTGEPSGELAEMPGMQPHVDVWSISYLLPTFIMWAIMMVAMMLPSAAPMILLFGRVAKGAGPALKTSLFALSYVIVWAVFSLAASVAQALLISAGILSDMTLAFGNNAIAGGLLLLVGLYQLSPLKEACLDACRSPLSFILRLWRPGIAGTLRLGFAHGAYCLGCCWGLMLLLFVGGVMNIAWIVGLALLVLLEKAAPVNLRKPVSVLLVVGGATLALSSFQ